MGDDLDLRQEWALIHQKTNGTGTVRLMGRRGNIRHFGFDQYPGSYYPAPPVEPGKEELFMPRITRVGASGVVFRIAYGFTDGREKPDMASFRLSGNALVETYQVITDYLRENYDGWFQLRNANGNHLGRGCFSSDD